MMRIFSYLIITVFFTLQISCSTNSRIFEIIEDKPLVDEDYIIQSYSLQCTQPTIDSNLALTPTSCKIIVENAENYKLEKIKLTTSQKWCELVSSNNPKISQSASIWLYYLHNEKIDILGLVLLQDSTNNFKKSQVEFWSEYLNIK